MIERAREFVTRIPAKAELVAAVVYGSVARGDFNQWSDIDLLVVARNLPERFLDRNDVLAPAAVAGVQAIAWTPDEFEHALSKRNAIAVDALDHGVVIAGSLPQIAAAD